MRESKKIVGTYFGSPKTLYKLVDYYTGKEVSPIYHESEEDALSAKQAYLSYKARMKEIHNNLIVIEKVII